MSNSVKQLRHIWCFFSLFEHTHLVVIWSDKGFFAQTRRWSGDDFKPPQLSSPVQPIEQVLLPPSPFAVLPQPVSNFDHLQFTFKNIARIAKLFWLGKERLDWKKAWLLVVHADHVFQVLEDDVWCYGMVWYRALPSVSKEHGVIDSWKGYFVTLVWVLSIG